LAKHLNEVDDLQAHIDANVETWLPMSLGVKI
jgi:hypothetical protein